MHAVVLLAHFHSLSSFVYGCGINAEVDHPDGHCYSPSPEEALAAGQHANGHSVAVPQVSIKMRMVTL